MLRRIFKKRIVNVTTATINITGLVRATLDLKNMDNLVTSSHEAL